jgi:D-3-phosphoglycerate dehydrogenase
MKEDELLKVIGNYDGLVVRSATKVTAPVLQAGVRLQIVGRAGVGVDNIDIQAATKNGVMVMNTPNGNTVSTAQLALSLLMNMVRKIPIANIDVKNGNWNPKNFSGMEIDGKTIGIVGCGRIGQVSLCQCVRVSRHVVCEMCLCAMM